MLTLPCSIAARWWCFVRQSESLPARHCQADLSCKPCASPPCSLDTGRLNAETYQIFDAVEKHYGIRIEYTFPDAQETMDLVRTKGMYSFYEDGHQECCRVRKVRHLTIMTPARETSCRAPASSSEHRRASRVLPCAQHEHRQDVLLSKSSSGMVPWLAVMP